MYKSIVELVSEIEKETDTQKQIQLIQKLSKENRDLKTFFQWAYFNTQTAVITEIGDYKPNHVPIGLSYMKLEKAMRMLPRFFNVHLSKKVTDVLYSILEEMSWLEVPTYEALVMNKYTNKLISKETVLQAFPEMKEIR